LAFVKELIHIQSKLPVPCW